MNFIFNFCWWVSKGKWFKGCVEVGLICVDVVMVFLEVKVIMENFVLCVGNYIVCILGVFKLMVDWLEKWG